MEKRREKKERMSIGVIILLWLLVFLGLLLAATLLVCSLKLREGQIRYVAVGIVFLSTLLATMLTAIRGKMKARKISSVVCGLVLAASQLMLGFVCYGEQMTISGVCGILAGSASAVVISMLIGRTGGKRRKRRILK